MALLTGRYVAEYTGHVVWSPRNYRSAFAGPRAGELRPECIECGIYSGRSLEIEASPKPAVD